MWTWSAVVRRLRALFDRDAVEREMDEELRLHFELEAREHEQRGLSATAARRAAMISFGGVDGVKEAYRDARGVRSLENLMHDLRYALRTLVRQRVFSATVVLTLAIGLGATTAILTLVDAAWLGWSRPYREADRLTMVYKRFAQGFGPTSPFDFRDWRNGLETFEPLAGYMRSGAKITTSGDPTIVNVVASTSNYFSLLGLRPTIGRFYRDDEEQWGRNGVAVLSYGCWQRDFGGDPTIIGRKVTLDDKPVEIIGVAPRYAWFGANPPSVFVPLSFAPNDPTNARHSHFMFALGRLRRGVSLDQARAEARGLAARIAVDNPENAGTSIDVEPLDEVVLGDVRPMLRLLLGAVALLLIIACANVANLMLVRSTARFREMSVRAALGASIGRIAQQVITESLVLAVVGGALGIGLALLLLHVVGPSLPTSLPHITESGLRLGGAVAALSLAAIVGSGVVCGLVPSIQLARRVGRHGSSESLRDGGRSVAGGTQSAVVRSSLVVSQISIAFVLLVVSGLFARSLMRLQQENTGVRGSEHVMSMLLPVSRSVALDSAAHVRFFDDVLRSVREIPGVASAGVSSNLPLSGGGETKSFWIEGHEPTTEAEVGSVVGRMESTSSLQSMGATLIRGRWFEESDRGAAPNVAIIGEGVARKYFAGQNPLGQRISLHPPEALRGKSKLPPGGRWPRWTVVGVVKDVKYSSPRDEPEKAVYVHYPQGLQVWGWGPRWLVVRTSGDPMILAPAIRAALRSLDATIPVGTMLPLDERMALSLRAPRFTTMLITGFAVVAVVLCAIGLYGVIAYSVSRDTRAFGIRVALGATASDVARHVVTRGVRLAAIGITAGLAAAFAATRWIEAQLFGVGARDPMTYAASVGGLVALTLLASYLPARRAARVDPVITLRSE